jgi:acyl-CoA synthetase (AMP-forming)/AMP-acid ligase II
MILRGPHPDSERPTPGDERADWNTLPAIVRGAVERHPERGIYLVDRRGTHEFRTYEQLADAAGRVGDALAARGVGLGDRVLVSLPTSYDFLGAFFGASSIGAIPVPVPAPSPAGRRRAQGPDYLLEFARQVDARAILYEHQLDPALRPHTGLGQSLRVASDLPSLLEAAGTDAHSNATTRAALPEIAYIQPTSGTAAPPRAAALTHENLLSNVRAIGRALHIDPGGGDFGVSWLPLHNIMGLIGFVIFSMYWGQDLALLDPERFLKHPEDWLWLIARHEATISAAPDFGYSYAVRRCRESELEGLDLSSWRVAMSGAEPVRPRHLRDFLARFERYGLQPEALTPVYGLTEATLGVTFDDPRREPRVEVYDRRALEREGRAVPLSNGETSLSRRRALVSLGRPLEGIELEILDPDGIALAERRLGSIAVRGPNIMMEYVDRDAAEPGVGPSWIDEEGWLHTGDLGFVDDGELFVVERERDVIVTHDGRRLDPSEIDFVVNKIDGVRGGSTVSFGSREGEEPRIVVAFETQSGVGIEEVEEAIRRALELRLGVFPDELVCLSPNSVPKTPTGKVRRRLAAALHRAGRLDRRDRQRELEGLRRVLFRARGEVLRAGQNVLDRLGRLLER